MTQEDLYALSDEELLNQSFTDEPMQENVEEPEQTQDDVDKSGELPQDVVETEEQTSSADEPSDEVDYQAFYETMTKPFKANGREVQIKNADDAIRLMQQGVNYSKKMEELKPKRVLLKVLEEQGLADKEKLGYLIDLANKDQKAIAKLIKESEIDLYDFDTQQADDYSPNLELKEPSAFEDIVSEITANDPSMVETLSLMGQWDNESKDILFNEPNILKVIAQQKANGFFDRVVDMVENERMLGRMTDIPYLQAYSEIEAKLLAQEQSNSFTGTRPTVNDNSNVDKKKRASMPNSGGNAQNTGFNPLTATDEELIQYINSQSIS